MTGWINSWSPWTEMNRLQEEFNRLFGRQFREVPAKRTNIPAVNLWQDEDRLLLTVELPGREVDDIDVTVTRDRVTIAEKERKEEKSDHATWLRRERAVEPVERTIELPVEVDPESVQAEYEKGILTVEMHRPEEHKPRKVSVKAG
ncbi:MAG: Hsp20/alpha crystallin family protein [Planctomycetaceae bacterium]